MTITVRPFRQTDRKNVEKAMTRLQDHLVKMDPLNRLRCAQKYGEKYTRHLMKKIKRDGGAVFVAMEDKKMVGCIAGKVMKQSAVDRLDCVPTRAGRILELFVEESHRGNGVGKQLIKTMEKYFLKKGCDVVRVEVFEPNKSAHGFYRHMKFEDRTIDMIKKL